MIKAGERISYIVNSEIRLGTRIWSRPADISSCRVGANLKLKVESLNWQLGCNHVIMLITTMVDQTTARNIQETGKSHAKFLRIKNSQVSEVNATHSTARNKATRCMPLLLHLIRQQ